MGMAIPQLVALYYQMKFPVPSASRQETEKSDDPHPAELFPVAP